MYFYKSYNKIIQWENLKTSKKSYKFLLKMQPKLTIDTNAAFTYHIPMINLEELGEQGSGNTGIDYNTR